MSFINWGHESPEQRAARKKMDDQLLFEQAMYNASMTAAASVGAGRISGWIDKALAKINSRYAEVTSLIPNIYYFWDDDSEGYRNGIGDGGNDMYDGANYMNTDLTQLWEDIVADDQDVALCIPYTHTQAEDYSDLPDQYLNPPMDGEVVDGKDYFGSGSKYFTNMYPGLFVMIADNVKVSEFTIGGNVGSDGQGLGAGYVDSVVPGWTLFYKTNTDNLDADPSINQLILVPGTSSGIDHLYDTTSRYDDHAVRGISDRPRIVYAVVSRIPEEEALSEWDAITIAQKILEIIL